MQKQTPNPKTVATTKPTPQKPKISIQVNAKGEAFAPAFEKVRRAGLTKIQALSLNWTDIEKGEKLEREANKPGVFDNPFPAIANAFYPAQGTQILLVLRPINTNKIEMPADLMGKEWDDPLVIARFNAMLSWVLKQMPKVTLCGIAIGNEVDATLGTDAKKWAAYSRFFNQTATAARKLKPGVPVGVCTQGSAWLGKEKEFLFALNTQADQVFVNYYPINSDFSVKEISESIEDIKIIRGYAQKIKKPVFFTEMGCPSAIECLSSEKLQSLFVQAVLDLVKRTPEGLTGMLFQWLLEQTPEEIATLTNYYGITDPAFAGFLKSIGMWEEKNEKKAYQQLANYMRR